MSKLIVRNTSPSSITISGFTVYNIRSENSSFVVEVEGTSNTDPSVGDIITFGNYPQATSTPEDLEWIVLDVDTTNRRALLVSRKVIDCQQYNTTSTTVTWETCSLRTWCNNTFLNAAFSASEQSRIPTTTIQNPNNPTFGTSGGNPTNDKVFCLSLQEASNTAYFANSNSRKSLATQKAINGGASQVSGYTAWWLRTPGSNSTVACIVRYDGDFNNSGIIVENTTVGIRPALWMDYSQIVRFKAFKYTFNGISYYYVVDGIHNVWVNDLSSIGYSEVPSVVLPTVNTTNNIYHRLRFNRSGGDYTFSARGTTSVYSDSPTDPTYVDWDSTKVYGVIKYYNSDQTFVGRQGITPIEAPSWGEAGKIYMENNSGDSLTVSKIRVATCSDSSATVVPVYDSSNNPYNAFKFTASGTDYYYVLDGTQTDWTDDINSIGYHLPIVLPTVSVSGYWSNNSYNWLQSIEGPESVPANSLSSVLRYGYAESEQTVYVSPDYESGKKYSIIQWQQSGGTTAGRTEFEIVESNGKMCAKNVSGGTLTFYQAKIAVCSSNQATIITVYDSQNIAYNAFSFTLNDADYYYVLDGTQTDWTNDLTSIGYSLTPPVVLPTVTIEFYDAWGSWLNAGNSSSAKQVIASNSISTTWFYKKDGSQYSIFYPLEEPYDSSKSYAVMRWNSAYGVFGGYYGFSIVSENGYYGVKNITSSSISVNSVRVAVCSSNQATVVTVYDSSNVAYNAFKFTASGTDYCYVLDGTQTDWTDDLASIGYSLTPATVVAYLNSNKTAIVMQSGEQTYLRDGSGHPLEYDSTKTYSAYKYYRSSSDTTGMDATGIRIGYLSGWSYLMLTNNTGSQIQIQRIEYTIS